MLSAGPVAFSVVSHRRALPFLKPFATRQLECNGEHPHAMHSFSLVKCDITQDTRLHRTK